jgi:uncharacterized membrane protein
VVKGTLNGRHKSPHTTEKRMNNTAIKSWADIGHAEREQIADDMSEECRRVIVERFGTGNAQHSGVLGGCGVSYIVASN